MKGLNTTLAWLEEVIVISGKLHMHRHGLLPTWPVIVHLPCLSVYAVQCYKKCHYGRLPPNMRRLYYKATIEGCGFITRQSPLQADYEHMVPGMPPHDFDLNPHLGPDPASMDA